MMGLIMCAMRDIDKGKKAKFHVSSIGNIDWM